MNLANSYNELLQRLMARRIDPVGLANVISTGSYVPSGSDCDLLVQRIMTRALETAQVVRVVALLEKEALTGYPADVDSEELRLDRELEASRVPVMQRPNELLTQFPSVPVKLSKRVPHRDLGKVWTEYRKGKSESLRNILMEHYLHLVRYNAERIHVKLPDEVELDDLMSAGIFGLMDAIAAFDPDRGVRFETYCVPRIRGAILDELRSMDWVPHLVRSRAHKLDSASKQLEVELGRPPSNDEIANRLKVPLAEFEKMAKDARAVGIVSVSRKWFETESSKDVREIEPPETKRGADPIREIQRQRPEGAHHKGSEPGGTADHHPLLFRRDDDEGDRCHAGPLRVSRQPDAQLDPCPPQGPDG